MYIYKVIFLTLAFIVLIAPTKSSAQSNTRLDTAALAQLQGYEDTLGLLSFLVLNDSLPEARFAACKKLITTLVKALKIENSFYYPFERMRHVSILYPPDSTFRIFTWQLYAGVDEYRYYGAIQINSPKLQLIPLSDRSFTVETPEFEVLPPERWYGAVYYNLLPFDTPEGKKYLLFGYNALGLFQHRKIIDVLSLVDGKATFGAPVFNYHDPLTGENAIHYRIVKTYSAEASFRLNWDESLDMIVFDHLTTIGGQYGQGPTMVPDGTYEGFRLENGKWVWVPMLDYQAVDEPPRPAPILDERKGKDLFGKPKKGNK